MRTTVTFDPEVEKLVRREMHRRRASFEQAVHDGLRLALGNRGTPRRVETPTFDLGEPRVNLDRALALAATFEDNDRVQRRTFGR